MQQILDALFSPLDKRYCLYFFYLTVLAFIAFALAVVGVLGRLMKKGKKDLTLLLALLGPFLAYFQSRLFYSMCVN